MDLRALRRYARPPAPATRRCELCGAALGGGAHAHVFEVGPGKLACACNACAVLFRDARAGGGRYRTVPDRVLSGRSPVGEADWAALGIPVRLAFLVRRAGAWLSFYPSPAGPVEAPLPEEAGRALGERVPLSAEVADDVEALLVHRGECLLVPIDACHELSGLVRRTWRGFSGGDEAHSAIEAFFARLRGRARPFPRAGGDP